MSRLPSLYAIGAELARRKAASDDEELAALTRLAARLEPKLRRLLLAAFAAIQIEVDPEELAHAAQHGTEAQLARAAQLSKLAEALRGTEHYLRQGAAGGGQLGVDTLSAAGVNVDLLARFNLVNVHAVNYGRERAGWLINRIGDQAQNALPVIRELVAGSMRGEMTPDELAMALRPAVRSIGLPERQARSVLNFHEELTDKLEEQGLPDAVVAEKVAARTDRYADAVERKHAQLIARTETIAASNQGQLDIWGEAKAQGLLPEETRKLWIATYDDRLDPICEALGADEDGVLLSEDFITEDGERLDGPPAHPNCRCATALKVSSGSESE